MRKYPRIKAFSLGAAVVDDEEELDLGDIDLEGDDEPEGGEDDGDETEEPEEDEGESEESDGDEESEDDGEEQPRRSRAQTRFQKIIKARKEAEAENIALKRKLDELAAQQTRSSTQQNDPQAIQAWLNSLPPAERKQAELQIELANHRGQMATIRFEMQDSADKSAYEARAASNPVYRKYAAQVEAKLMDLRKNQNLNAPREEILKHIIGELVLKNKGKPVSSKKAKKSIDKHTVKVTNGRSDIKNTGRVGKTPRERLEGVKF